MLDGMDWMCSDHTIVNSNLYFVPGRGDVIATVDMETWKTNYRFGVKNFDWIRKNRAWYTASINEKIFIINGSPMRIALYDTELGLIEQIFEDLEFDAILFGLELWNECLYIFRRNKDEIIKVDKVGNCTSTPFLQGVDKTWMRSCKVEDGVLFFPKMGNRCYKYSFSNGEISEFEIPFSVDECMDVSYKNDNVYILDGKKIMIWNKKDNLQTIKLQLCDENTIRGMMIPLKDIIYVLPRTGDDIFIVTYDGKVKTYSDYPDDYHYTQSEDWMKVGSKYFSYIEKRGIYYFPRRATNYMLTINVESQSINWISIHEPDITEEIRLELDKTGCLINEKRGYLENILSII